MEQLGHSHEEVIPDSTHRPRCRELGIVIGDFPTGPLNSITDVHGVRVGQVTLIKGDGPLRTGEGPVRTGVTAILPHGGNTILEPVEAGAFVFNGAGTTTGLSLIEEFGIVETPICLTNTLSVGTVYDAVARYVARYFMDTIPERSWFNPVVGETDDSFLNDIHGFHVEREHVWRAIQSASAGDVVEGVVGAGTGISTCCFKSGIGTSSRLVKVEGETFVVGTLVQSNFRGSLVVGGVPVGKEISRIQGGEEPGGDGSLMVIVATDCPLDSRKLTRIATRGTMGMARTGAEGGHSSGDYFIAFSTSYRKPAAQSLAKTGFHEVLLRDESFLNPLFAAVADAVEEAILNSIFKAVTTMGRDENVSRELDLGEMLEAFRRHGKLV